MDPVIVVTASLAVVFAIFALLQWRRAEDLEGRVKELEAKLHDSLPAPKDMLPPPPVVQAPAPEPPVEAAAASDEDDESEREEASAEDEPDDADEEDSDDEDADDEDADDEDADDEDADEEEDADDEDSDDEDEPEEAEQREEAPVAKEEPAIAAAEPSPPKPAAPDPRRIEALKVVAEAFELARYLDFDAIVEKPSTYRVTVPLTAANASAVRYLEDGMFGCLKEVRLEDSTAVLHIDTSKGPP